MRLAFRILAGIMSLMGSIWILQGLNFLAGSPMTGDPFWARAGAVLLVVGLGLGGASMLRRKSPGEE